MMVQLAIPGVGVLGGCPGLHLWRRGGVGRGKREMPHPDKYCSRMEAENCDSARLTQFRSGRLRLRVAPHMRRSGECTHVYLSIYLSSQRGLDLTR